MGTDPNDCFYCARDERLAKILIEICRLEASTLYLFREQTCRGRCIVALDVHETELFRLDRDTLQRFSRDVPRAAAALQRAFVPDKINYAIYGDLAPHLHFRSSRSTGTAQDGASRLRSIRRRSTIFPMTVTGRSSRQSRRTFPRDGVQGRPHVRGFPVSRRNVTISRRSGETWAPFGLSEQRDSPSRPC